MFRKISEVGAGVINFFGRTKLQIVYCFLMLAVLAMALLAYSPQQAPVVIYKLLLAPLGGFTGCCVWLALMPYANPSRYLARNWRDNPDADAEGGPDFEIADDYGAVFCVCLVCAVLAFCFGMLAVGMGL